MQSKVQKWGNSLAIRLPKAIAQSAQLDTGSVISFRVEDGKIIIEPKFPKVYSLDELLNGVTPQNLHKETDWGKPRGKEVW